MQTHTQEAQPQKRTFTPDQRQIKAAATVIVAKAFHETVKPIYEKIEREVLESGSFKYDDYYYNEPRLNLKPDETIKDPKRAYMMAGLKEYCYNENATNDAAKFYSEVRRKMQNAGFIHGENAEAKASWELVCAERELIAAMFPITKIDNEMASSTLETRAKLIDLTLNLLVPFESVKRMSKEMERTYFNERTGKGGNNEL